MTTKHHSIDQPRHPAGSSQGGQFASAGGGAFMDAMYAGADMSPQRWQGMMRQLHEKGGFSQSKTGESPDSGFMTATKESAPRVFEKPIDEIGTKDLTMFFANNWDLLQQEGFYMGGWVEKGIACLDVSCNFSSLTEALLVAIEGEQTGIYDLGSDKTYYTADYDYDDLMKKYREEFGNDWRK